MCLCVCDTAKRMATIGTQKARKLKRNRLVRVCRGAAKLGNPTPGQSSAYALPIDAAYQTHGTKLRADVAELVTPYWHTI